MHTPLGHNSSFCEARPLEQENKSSEELFCLLVVSERGAWLFAVFFFFSKNQINRRIAQQRAIIFHESGQMCTWIHEVLLYFYIKAVGYLEAHFSLRHSI